MPSPDSRRNPSQAGLSLVEVLVASAILGLVITGMMAVIANVSRLDTGADEYRQARIFLKEEIEDPYRHYTRYGAIAGYAHYDGLRLDADPPAYAGIPAEASVLIDVEDVVTINGVEVPFMRVRATMTWIDPDQTAKDLTLSKLVTKLQ